jgi:hypothetical protein
VGRKHCRTIKKENKGNGKNMKGCFIVDTEALLTQPKMKGFDEFPPDKIIPLSNFEVVERDGDRCLRIVGKEDNKFIAHLVKTSECRLNSTRHDEDVAAFDELFAVKNDLKRDGEHLSCQERYVAIGARVSRRNVLGFYAFKSNVLMKKRKQVTKKMKLILRDITRIAQGKISPKMLKQFRRCAHVTELDKTTKSVSLWAQMVVARNYMAVAHTDRDAVFGIISCRSSKQRKFMDEATRNEIIAYFVFPEYGIAIPLRNGDVLLFDPTVMHCATNPRDAKAFLFSAYTSVKVVAVSTFNWMVSVGLAVREEKKPSDDGKQKACVDDDNEISEENALGSDCGDSDVDNKGSDEEENTSVAEDNKIGEDEDGKEVDVDAEASDGGIEGYESGEDSPDEEEVDTYTEDDECDISDGELDGVADLTIN